MGGGPLILIDSLDENPNDEKVHLKDLKKEKLSNLTIKIEPNKESENEKILYYRLNELEKK